jgi:TIR domain
MARDCIGFAELVCWARKTRSRIHFFQGCGLNDIFLSCNREDASVAQRYADALEHAGLSVWWDAALRSGEAYDEVTEAALREAKAVVVLWSPRSVVSRWVRAEATVAERNKTLVPVMIEACERPIMFELTQTADLTHWDGRADDPAWLALLRDVRRFAGRDLSWLFPISHQSGLVTVLRRSRISLCHLCFECERADAAQI